MPLNWGPGFRRNQVQDLSNSSETLTRVSNGNFLPFPNKDTGFRHKSRILRQALMDTFNEYCRETKVNGPLYWQKGFNKGFTRMVWIVTPMVILVLGLFLVLSLWQRFLQSPTRMTIGKPLFVTQVPFPAISLCHPRTVVDYKANDFVERIKLPPGITQERLISALPVLGIINENQWEKLPKLEEVTIVNNVLELNNISLFTAATQLGKTCEDFLVQCRFAGREFPCFQKDKYLSWTTTTSHYGTCCSFNYNAQTLDHIPFASNTFGSEGGLTIVGTGYPASDRGTSGNFYSSGIIATVHHTFDYALETSQYSLVASQREIFMAIHATEIRCDDQVLDLPENQRLCVDPADYNNNEMEMESYRQSFCLLGCLREQIHKTCECHPFYLPRKLVFGRTRPIRDCNVVDGLCLANNYGKFKSTQCNCLPLCNEVKYSVNTFSVQLFPGAVNFSVSGLYSLTNHTEHEFVMHFFMAKQTSPSNLRVVVMSWITLLSNLGGVFSLCMGLSIISLVEILYFTLIRMRYHYNHQQLSQTVNSKQCSDNTKALIRELQEKRSDRL